MRRLIYNVGTQTWQGSSSPAFYSLLLSWRSIRSYSYYSRSPGCRDSSYHLHASLSLPAIHFSPLFSSPSFPSPLALPFPLPFCHFSSCKLMPCLWRPKVRSTPTDCTQASTTTSTRRNNSALPLRKSRRSTSPPRMEKRCMRGTSCLCPPSQRIKTR